MSFEFHPFFSFFFSECLHYYCASNYYNYFKSSTLHIVVLSSNILYPWFNKVSLRWWIARFEIEVEDRGERRAQKQGYFADFSIGWLWSGQPTPHLTLEAWEHGTSSDSNGIAWYFKCREWRVQTTAVKRQPWQMLHKEVVTSCWRILSQG
jgi:hypothetical protein